MTETVHADKDASSNKEETKNGGSDSKVNDPDRNGTVDGVVVKNEETVAKEKSPDKASSIASESVEGTSSGKSKSVETVSLAMQHLAAGKRDLLVGETNAAVASLALACELLGTHYGETAFECGEAYYYYGKALLELARAETGVLDKDGLVDGEAESEENDTTEEDGKQESPEKPQNLDKKSEKNDITEEDGKKESPEKGQDLDEKNIKGENEKTKDETENAENKNDSPVKDQEDTKEENGEDEEPSNIQLAWEMIELAKTVLVKQAESIQVVNAKDNTDAEEKAKLKADVENRVSDTFQTLGELSIENENYAQAIEDLETCLKRRQQMMPADCRSIAETHFQLGIAQGFNLQFDEAVGSLEAAINVLELRIKNLQSKTESKSPTKAAFSTRDDEIKEIESLIPEIKEKIDDTKDMKKETFKKLSEKKQLEEGIAAAFSSGNATPVNGESSKAASTISSSLIKKRPATDSSDTKEAKKLHLESSKPANSTSAENGETKKGV